MFKFLILSLSSSITSSGTHLEGSSRVRKHIKNMFLVELDKNICQIEPLLRLCFRWEEAKVSPGFHPTHFIIYLFLACYKKMLTNQFLTQLGLRG